MTEDDERRRFQEMVQQHEAEQGDIRSTAFKRIGFALAAGIITGLLVTQLPTPLALGVTCIVTAYVVYVAHRSTYPRPCEICGAGGAVPLGRGRAYRPRDWWDLRPPGRMEIIWLCAGDLRAYLEQQGR
jgi:hypothetical protein